MLRNPYYVGEIIYRGASYEGNHEQIINSTTWHQVQDVLDAHNSAGDRQRVHEHYLKGSVFCGSCGSRLMINKATNSKGVPYDYFVCLGRHRKRTDCTRQAMAVATVESAVENAWARIRLTPFERKTAEGRISDELKAQTKNQDGEKQQYQNQQAALLAERSKLLTAHYADAIPLDLLKVEQERISLSLNFIDRELSSMVGDSTRITDHLDGILSLLQHCEEAYKEAKPQQRRMMNQAVADEIYIDEDGSAYFELDETVAVIRGAGIRTQAQLPRLTSSRTASPDKTKAPPALWATQFPDAQTENPRGFTASGISISKLPEYFHEQSWNNVLWVELRGFEPLTPCMPCRCATSCAIAPYFHASRGLHPAEAT
jgi:site-specific DNA recombinase